MKRTTPWVLALSVLSLGGCSSIPAFEERVRPLEPICSNEGSPGPCPGEQLCLSGRCFEACAGDTDCGAREECDEGVCVDTGVGLDGGVFDSGATMPCDDSCEESEVCDVITNVCVSCFDGRQCSEDTPVCDYAQGECVAAHDGDACRPCNETTDCADGSMCILRTGFTERVCLATCEIPEDCPSGFICDVGEGVCVPPLGGCTQLRRSLDQITCDTDLSCVARGGTAEEGTCSPETSNCLAACSPEAGCPGDWTCDNGTYCEPPPMLPAM